MPTHVYRQPSMSRLSRRLWSRILAPPRLICIRSGHLGVIFNSHRDEVAGCSERAYPSLKMEDAQRLLLIQNQQEAAQYAAEVRPPHRHRTSQLLMPRIAEYWPVCLLECRFSFI